jgi:hypothetical protein
MIGLGAPTEPKPESKPDIDKLRELEERVAKLEKQSVWFKVLLSFLGLWVLLNQKKNAD